MIISLAKIQNFSQLFPFSERFVGYHYIELLMIYFLDPIGSRPLFGITFYTSVLEQLPVLVFDHFFTVCRMENMYVGCMTFAKSTCLCHNSLLDSGEVCKNRRLSINFRSRYNKKWDEAFIFLINIMYDRVVVHGTVTIAP